MSFIQENFMPDRAAFNSSLTSQCFGIHRFISSTDTFSEIESLDYFPAYFGLDKDSIKNNDYLYVQDSDENFKQYLISLDEFGDITLVASVEDLVVTSVIHGLDPVLTYNIDLIFALRDNFVTIIIPSFALPSPTVTSFATIALPTNFLPLTSSVPFYEYMFITDNNVQTYGMIKVDSNMITIGPAGPGSGLPIQQFTSAAPMGWEKSKYNWPLNVL